MEKHQQAVHNRRHNNTHAATMTTTAQLAIEAKQHRSKTLRLTTTCTIAKKFFKKGLPRTTLLCLFLQRPLTTVFKTSSQQQLANTRRHEEKSRFFYVQGIS